MAGFLLAIYRHDSALAPRMEGVGHSEVLAALLLSPVEWGALAAGSRCRQLRAGDPHQQG